MRVKSTSMNQNRTNREILLTPSRTRKKKSVTSTLNHWWQSSYQCVISAPVGLNEWRGHAGRMWFVNAHQCCVFIWLIKAKEEDEQKLAKSISLLKSQHHHLLQCLEKTTVGTLQHVFLSLNHKNPPINEVKKIQQVFYYDDILIGDKEKKLQGKHVIRIRQPHENSNSTNVIVMHLIYFLPLCCSYNLLWVSLYVLHNVLQHLNLYRYVWGDHADFNTLAHYC